MSKIVLAALTKKHCSNTTSKRAPTNSTTSNFNCKKGNMFHYEESLFVTGERLQLLPLPAKNSKHLDEKHGNLGDERAIVLELYEEERKSGILSDVSGGIRWSRSAVKRLKDRSKVPYRLSKQVCEKSDQI